MPTNAQLQKANRELRGQVKHLEDEMHAIKHVHAVTPINPDESTASEESEAPNDEISLKDAVAALVNSQSAMMEMMRNTNNHKRKVYVDKPDKFDGKVGDYIENWLEQFET